MDINNVMEECDWVCSSCDEILVTHLAEAFKDNLLRKKTLDEWADWLEGVVDQVIINKINTKNVILLFILFKLNKN